jgi:hypothetical protein
LQHGKGIFLSLFVDGMGADGVEESSIFLDLKNDTYFFIDRNTPVVSEIAV